MLNATMSNPMKEHGRKRLKNRVKHMKEIHDSLGMFFEELFIEGQPFTARIVRTETGTQFCDDAN